MRRLATPETAAAALLVLLVVGYSLPLLYLSPLLALYLFFVAATVVVVRMAPASGGYWLGRPAVRRGIVLVLLAACLTWITAPAGALAVTSLPVLVVVVLG